MTLADTTEAAERMALTLAQGGMQKATARVLAAFLFADTDSVTAPELAERLGISSGSVSGAIKMLSTVGLIERVPAPGSRREHYRLRDGAWATLMSAQNGMVQAMFQAADQGIAAAGPDSPAARRLEEMRDFYGFMFRELPALVERWRAERAQPSDPA
ncbi:GbsR/MarR family transcriptional regulator [Thermomonospora cellulosilytica]|uniref:DNA-binding transcriptional regulator GbsR (MarR family) n=1 Tax=Thermomonospora cellulosilytica TaxID=1411118 RepID=A0A7W3R9C5_9ACTN|nr:MarR family transcriptional regulator [Thermomonospora cellulosilytica]MBA9005188.1 DNA-binding transcriptional regulator GbsR (MarR family) [Thermomonospora cellulosilytica]